MQYTHVFELGQNVPQSVWSAAEITSIAVLADDPHIQHLCDARRVRERPLLGADHGAVSLEAGQVLEVMRPVPLPAHDVFSDGVLLMSECQRFLVANNRF